jgi:pyrophosphatase PpaX
VPAPVRSPIAALFDLDGTLIDSIDLILASARHAFAACGLNAPPDEEFASYIGIPLATQLRRFAADDAQLAALTDAYRSHQRQHLDAFTRCFDDVVHTVELLRRRHCRIGVVTSKGLPIAERSLSIVGLTELVDVVIGAESCARHKPDPEPVLLALDRLGIEPTHAVFVGDSPFDIQAGNAAGVVSIAALWGPFARPQLAPAAPDRWLERIADLPALLEQLFPLQTFRSVEPSDPVGSPGPADG